MAKFWRIAPMVVSGALLAVPAVAQQYGEPQAQPQPQFEQQQMQGESVPLQLGEDGIRQIQEALSERGHDVQADGQWNQQTADAVREFQREEGLDPSGDLTMSTVRALGVDIQELGQQPQQAEIPGEGQQPAIPEAEAEREAPMVTEPGMRQPPAD